MAALLLVGCTGDDQTAEHVAAPTTAELAGLVGIGPGATGWPTRWRSKPAGAAVRTRAELERGGGGISSDPGFELGVDLTAALLKAGFVEAHQRGWQAGATVAQLSVAGYETPDGAEDGLAAEKRYAEGWYREVEHQTLRELEAGELADESWAAGGGNDAAGFVDVKWRRGSTTFSIYLRCSPCPTDVADAARRWAEVVDARAGGVPG